MCLIPIPELSLVVLIGPSGSGKSTFARKHFKPTEILSSDFCRGLVSDDENEQAATKDAFEVLHFVAAKRLAAGKLVVVDATNVQPEARKPLVELARRYHVLPVAIALNLPERLCHERNRNRPERDFGPHVVRQHVQQLRRSLGALRREGFRDVCVLSSPEEVEDAIVERRRLWTDRRDDHGPFDIIGDVHGCFAELLELLAKLGYVREETGQLGNWEIDHSPGNSLVSQFPNPHPHVPVLAYRHPEGRRAIFLGDIIDRGPRVLDAYRLVRGMVDAGHALCLPGNHDMKLVRKLRGRDVQITHGLDKTLAEIESLPEGDRESVTKEIAEFFDGLVSHYVLDGGKLVVAHAGMKQELQGRASPRVRDFALYGETTGETDEFGLPVRYDWAADYRGAAMVVYGHTPVPEPEWFNRTINLDTGCVFGGRLTALRYPEKELVSVPAVRVYCEPARPFAPAVPDHPTLTAQQLHDEILDIDDVLGKRFIETRLRRNVTIREENAIAALEVMSRFAANPKWIIYLPPTMSPSETTEQPGLLEHPREAFDYYRREGVERVVCEEKHMGSRAVVIVCRDETAARRRFGVMDDGFGICLTRTGRRFFDKPAIEAEVLEQVRGAISRAQIWEEFGTDWLCLDCELMPWSAKAESLLTQQYAPVGAAARAAVTQAQAALDQAAAQGQEVTDLQERCAARLEMADRYVAAYRRYCWTVDSARDLRLAPFHLLATEGKVHVDRDHVWHMDTLERICQAGGDGSPLLATPYRVVDLADPASQEAGIRWWEALTEGGGEGIVVKPFDFLARGRHGPAQPAVKCRGKEYLRIIYGPEYSAPENLERLRQRRMAAKRSLALREFALGVEALERFVRGEPLRRVHECVFGVLALESEPVDPRL
jgi:protein phosphatase